MSVGEADAKAVQATSLNHGPYFVQLCHLHLRQKIQQRKRFGAVSKRSKSKLRSDKWMSHNLPKVQELAQFPVSQA